MNKAKLLGLTAVITTLFASIASLIIYLLYSRNTYLYYSILWFIIAVIDIFLTLWEPRKGVDDAMSCDDLRGSIELLAMINYLRKNTGDQLISLRIKDLISRRDRFSEAIYSLCGEEIGDKFNEVFRYIDDEERVMDVIKKIHECMIIHGCESNVFLEEE